VTGFAHELRRNLFRFSKRDGSSRLEAARLALLGNGITNGPYSLREKYLPYEMLSVPPLRHIKALADVDEGGHGRLAGQASERSLIRGRAALFGAAYRVPLILVARMEDKTRSPRW